jgi:superfamily II DNA or RNA helicase
MVEVSDVHKKVLRRAKSADEFNLYRAGLEWDLTDPIVIESEQDFKSAPRWQERLKPFQHQVTNLITFCRRLPVTLLADDVGLGKTISAGLIISELVSRSRISKVLVVCPKILGPQWQSELESKFDIPAKFVTGRDLLTADFEEHGVVITTYNSARLYLDQIPDDRFQMLVLDEAHKLRNLYGVENPPKVAKCFYAALQARRFRFVLMLTATPIHNRLWDLYSLVDLLTVGRGHQNPFGSPGMFARRFIADDKEKARQLRQEAIEEFRSVVYGYMSRVRRGDARLYFPDRQVLRHQVDPTESELQLIKTIAEPIQKMNRLVQISILKALASSPEALNAMLKNMARNGTAPAELSRAVNDIVENMPLTAKLKGLGQLIEQLKKQNPDRWRIVIFTGLRETQTTIQNFLESSGLTVGIINGDSGSRNQETIQRFCANPPLHRVIVSTEAGAEGVNLQAANILVNFDLPWNPMIVEQRIGRIQRLGSEYESVVVYNLTLRNTFEDYIVGRLIEKLQMASNAIGDIDSLLQGVDGSDDDDEGEAFEDRLLDLVLAALQSKDKEKAAQLEVENIKRAIDTLEQERETIKGLLDGGEDSGYLGPRAPTLPPTARSMNLQDFTLRALNALGSKTSPHPPDLYAVEEARGRHFIRFAESSASNLRSVLYSESSGAFHRIVDQVTATGLHLVEDVDNDIDNQQFELLTEWANSFGGTIRNVEIEGARRRFKGNALVRVRATVLHDSYERLVEVPCKPEAHIYRNGPTALRALAPSIADIGEVGINLNKIAEAIDLDEGIAEFSRFYLERREHEVRYASGDERKARKLYDEFTPRFEATVVALDGEIARDVTSRVQFIIDQGEAYDATVTVRPSTGKIVDAPQQDLCTKSGRKVPRVCLAKCEITGARALRHLLGKSDLSGRIALPEYVEVCSVSGKNVLTDELGISDITGRKVATALLQRCEVTGKQAEKSLFGTCSFSNSAVLRSELAKSEISGRSFRRDQGAVSAYSGKAGHQQEFVSCFETRQLVSNNEAERCEESNELVRPDVLSRCEETGIRARPSLFDRCSATGKLVLKRLLVPSSVSQKRILKSQAIQSSSGNYCGQSETVQCAWSGEKFHPDDLGICELTGLKVHRDFLSAANPSLVPLVELLNNHEEPVTETQFPILENALKQRLNGAKCRIISGALSPTKSTLAVCAETKSMLGLKLRTLGFVFRPDKKEVIGNVAEGKRTKQGWIRTA